MTKKVIPNSLSVLRLLLSVFIFVSVFISVSFGLLQLAIIVGIISDKLDGTLARRWKVESELGKKLESLVDPIFISVTGLYLWAKLNFPGVFLLYGIGLLVATALARAAIKIKTTRLFYKKSMVTRLASFTFYVISLFYLFELPFRNQILWPITIFGTVAAANYFYLMYGFVKTAAQATSPASGQKS